MSWRSRFISIRTKFNLLAMFVLLVAILTNVVSSHFHSRTIRDYQAITTGQSSINEFFNSNRRIEGLFITYILDQTDTSHLLFEAELLRAYSILNDIIRSMPADSYRARFASLQEMLRSFEAQARIALSYVGSGNNEQMFLEARRALRINELIDFSYGRHIEFIVQVQATQAEALLSSIQLSNLMNVVTMTVGLLVIVVSFWFFSRKISKPIIQLADKATEMSEYNFNIQKIDIDTNDEIGKLARAFNIMQKSIVNYLEQLNNRSELSKKLMQNENKKLRSINLETEATLKTLQMQMNSHFLLNTLNLISRTALFEGAPQTIQLIDSTADFLRYSLYKAKSTVSIFEEIAFAETYITIQRMRFGDHISFDLSVDDNLQDVVVPTLIIQPLIENAIIHGTYDRIENSEIKVLVSQDGSDVKISVSDNGKGMDKNELENIFSDTDYGHSSRGGIGLNNVKQRLELFFKSDNILSVYSEKNQYFKVEITIQAALSPVGITVG